MGSNNHRESAKGETSIPSDRKYSRGHCWVRVEGDLATIGITPAALDDLTSVARITLYPNARDPYLPGGGFLASLYDGKGAHANVEAPLLLTFLEANPKLQTAPELVRTRWDSDGWLLRATVDPADLRKLLTAERYAKTIGASTTTHKDSRRPKKTTPREGSTVVASGFADLHFKLSVVSALMDAGHYTSEIEAIAQAAEGAEAYRPIAEVMAYVASLDIPKKRLAEITSLQPDGGDLIYQAATTEWDGEDDIFEITSIQGIDGLVNLTSFAPIAMITPKGLDYAPLLACKKLTHVDFGFAAKGAANRAVKKALAARGVNIRE